MMESSYTETDVEKRATAKEKGLVFLMGFGIAVSFFLMLAVSGYFLLLMFALIALMVYMTPRLMNVMYEYVFIDGQLDFEKIFAKSARKKIYTVDFDKVDICAPENSHALDGYRHNGVEVKDFTSLEPGRNVFCLVVTEGERHTLVRFEPDEKLLKAMKQKSPRKISEC